MTRTARATETVFKVGFVSSAADCEVADARDGDGDEASETAPAAKESYGSIISSREDAAGQQNHEEEKNQIPGMDEAARSGSLTTLLIARGVYSGFAAKTFLIACFMLLSWR